MASRVPAQGRNLQQRLRYFISNRAISFSPLENAAACRAEWDSGIWYSGATKKPWKITLLLSPCSRSGRAGRGAPGKPPGRSAGQLQESSCSRKEEKELDRASRRLQRRRAATSRVRHRGKDLLRVLEGVRTLTVHGSNGEGSVPREHASPLDWSTPWTPSAAQGALVTRNATQA